jgi:FkbM family methyltransferase
MSFFRSITAIYHRIRITSQMRHLDISSSGEEDDMAYVELKSGLRFYGMMPREKDKKYYKLLSSSTKQRIPFIAYQVALDIVIRYVEGGLKIGGPRKESMYKVRPGDTIAEMGAYMGYYTLYLAEKAGKEGKVIAIEPMPDNLKYLKKNVSYNKLKNVIVVEKGVWNSNETQYFFQKSNDTQSASMVLKSDESNKFSIEVNTLDTILKESNVSKVDFMIIQLNGVEPEALHGLTEVAPSNLSIAARYKSEDISPIPQIEGLLGNRGYSVTVKNNGYIYAKYQGE